MIASFLIAALSVGAAPTPGFAKTRHTAAPAPVAAPAAAQSAAKLTEPTISPKTEFSCGVVTIKDKTSEYHETAGLKVLGGPMGLVLPKTDNPVNAVSCKRDTIVPGVGDGRVIWNLGKALLLTDTSGRRGVVQMENNHFAYRILDGSLTPAETAAVQARLEILQLNYDTLRAQQGAKAPGADAPVPTKKP